MSDEQQVKETRKEINSMQKVLDGQISVIEMRQQEIQNLINNIENSINHLQLTLSKVECSKRTGIYTAISKNTETLIKLYEVYNKFEDSKFRYHKEIDDNIHKIQKFSYIELPKALSGSGDDNVSLNNLMAVLKTFSMKNNSDNDFINETKQELLIDDDYEL